ncbi:hypothetical protein CASFOL_037438 [Castilleja foliolosa]|uniref:Senescence regulator S40 n=1 Tax=Castilleja foliolosa TaxID=1961234 RepID=A0ABD3BP57_9LAMI
MERLPRGATHSGHHLRVSPCTHRIFGTLHPPQPSASTASVELSEDDIFSTPMECLPLSPTRPIPNPSTKPTNNVTLNHCGILAALNSYSSIRTRSGSGSDTRPLFIHKASLPPPTAGILIPKPPRYQRRFVARSAPIKIPVISAAVQRRARELEDAVSDGKEEEGNVMTLPPHELAESRYSPMLACSVMEGVGRTLKGRDLRQVRNAIWRRTGLID